MVIMFATLLAGACPAAALAVEYTIYEIKYTTDPEGGSPHSGEIVDCGGGIVVAKFRGFTPRIILQDPDFLDGWGGIQVKDWSANLDLYDAVAIGDDITLSNVTVEEFRGNTVLQWYPADGPGFTLLSQGNDPPPPIAVSAGQIPGPVCYGTGCWVDDHRAEPYEAMRIVVHNVTVGQKGLGKAEDNYELLQGGEVAWAADYMNIDVDAPYDYDPRIETGAHLASISGLLEQYKKQEASWDWDYYQLCTLSEDDIVLAGDVPAVSVGGLIAMVLLVVVAGVVVLRPAIQRAGRRGARCAP